MSSNFMDSIQAWFKKADKRVVAGGGVALALLLGGGVYYFMTSEKIDDTPVTEDCVPKETVTVSAEDHINGPANAPVTLVEYLSQTCSHCAEFRSEVIPQLEEKYVKTGKLRIVFRELHRNNVDIAASVLGRCLGRDGYLPFTDMLLQNQQTWMMREDQNVVEGLKDMSRRAGMSTAQFEECLKNQDLAQQLAKQSNQAAKDYCITGTPTLLLNGKKKEGMNTSFEKLDEAIKEELKKAGVALPAETAPADAATTATDGAASTDGAAPDSSTAPATEAAPGAPAAPTPPSQ